MLAAGLGQDIALSPSPRPHSLPRQHQQLVRGLAAGTARPWVAHERPQAPTHRLLNLLDPVVVMSELLFFILCPALSRRPGRRA